MADGDTVSGIAERFGLATAEVLAAQRARLVEPDLPRPAARALPAAAPAPDAAPAPPPVAPEIARHVVVEGDTMGGIAAAYGLDVASVLERERPRAVEPHLPGRVDRAAAHRRLRRRRGAAPAARPAAPAPTPPPTRAAETHLVVDGDTLVAIAARYGVTVAELDAINGLGGSTVILPGQRSSCARPTPVVTVASVSMPLDDETRANASIIIDVGRALGVPDQGIVDRPRRRGAGVRA